MTKPKLSDTKEANWQLAGHHYRVTMIRGRDSTRITFDFWGSKHDMDHGKAPSCYNVLSCLASDSTCPDTFEDFCGELGYDNDSIKVKRIFIRANTFAKKLRAFLTDEEQSSITEIQ